MKQYAQKEFIRIVQRNGYIYNRYSGDHAIYVKDGRHISIPQKLESVIARRLIKENSLETNIKRRKNMSKQTENFKTLVRGNSVSSIMAAINMLKPSVREELMKEYSASSANELAIKLC